MTDVPDPDRLLARVAADLDRGEAWRARRRLRQYLAQLPYDARYARALGELELARGELPAAGRWFWVAGSADPAHGEAVRLHLEHEGSDGERLWRSLPESVRRGIGDRDVPPHLATILSEYRIDATARQRDAREGREHRMASGPIESCFACGCAILVAIVTGSILWLGGRELWRILCAWLGW